MFAGRCASTCADPGQCFMYKTGDSGGPLVMRTLQGGVDKRYVDVLLGVVSFSPDYCGLKKSLSHIPDVFTSAVEALKWIEETIDSESKPEADPSCNTECGSICKSPRANQLCMMACLLVSCTFFTIPQVEFATEL